MLDLSSCIFPQNQENPMTPLQSLFAISTVNPYNHISVNIHHPVMRKALDINIHSHMSFKQRIYKLQ